MSVSILLGSMSDIEKMQGAVDALNEFGVHNELKILSAHRSPDLVAEYIKSSTAKGTKIFICGAGMAAHLAGAVAGHTSCPVIGVPLSGSALNGMDSLLATVQMPRGVPVATVAIDGSYNAGMLAIQMLAIGNNELSKKLVEYKATLVRKIQSANENL